MKKCLLIDFDDSFTYNIVQELTQFGTEIRVINWRDFVSLPQDGLLVLGPGPGHPDDYQVIFPLIREWLKNQRPFFGVCLGHQILWRVHDQEVIRSQWPLHGQKIKLRLSDEWQGWLGEKEAPWVQRYNSLCVPSTSAPECPHWTNYIQDDEIIITIGQNLISYQFHPESVGTSYRRSFFVPIVRDLI